MTLTATFVLLLLVAGFGILVQMGLWAQNPTVSSPTTANRLAQGGYVAEPGEDPSEETKNLLSLGDYFYNRVSYPTGRFDQRWIGQAAAQDSAIQRGVPAGRVIYNPQESNSPLTLDPNSFTSLGPQPLQSNGCSGCFSYGHVAGRTNVMAVDPVTPNVAYLGSDGGGVWKSTNCCTATTSWTAVTDDPLLTTIAIGDITIDPNNHNVVYAGTGDLRFGSFSFGSAGVLKSTNQGASWTVIGADVFTPIYPEPAGQYPQYQAIGKVKVDPRNSNNLIVGAKTGVYFSYNAGTNWTGPCLPDAFPTQRQDVTGLLTNNNGSTTDLYVAVGSRGFSTTVQYNLGENGANGIYKTTVPASGCPASWTLSSRPDNGWPAGTGSGIPFAQAGGDTLGRIDMAMAPSNPNYIYAQVQNIPTRGQLGLWRTTDGGTTWQQRSGVSGLTGCDGDYPQNWYDQGLAIDPNNPDIFMDTFDIWKSTDGGTVFVDLTCGYAGGNTVHVDHHALAYVPGSSSVLIAGSDGGAYVTLNANAANPTFSQLNDSLSTLEFYSGDITANFATSASPGANGGMQDNGSGVYVWSGTPGPALWQLRKGGDGMFARIEPVMGQRWYQESQNGNLSVSLTGPFGTLQNATGGWTADTRSFVFPYEIYKYDCPATGCTHMIAGSTRIWETITGAVPSSSWYANSGNLTKQTLADRSFINQLSYSVSLSTTAIVGTNDGNVQYGFGLGLGVANTATWVNVTGGNTTLPNRPIQDVTTDPVNPLVGYAAIGGFDQNTPSTPGHVFQVTCTANCGSFTWLNKTGNLPNIPVNSIMANPRFPQQIFAGTDFGLYYTNDVTVASPTWLRFQAGLPNVMIWDMAIDRGFTTLALWTRSRGAYVWPLPDGPVGGGTVTPTVVNATSTSTAVASSTVPASATRTATTGVSTSTATTAVSTSTATSPVGTATATCVPSGGTQDVSIGNLFFNPADLTVGAGTTVRWTNTQGSHSTTSDTAIWDSGVLALNGQFSYTFNTPGTYPYHCIVHPSDMTGTITVVAPCATAIATATAEATPTSCTISFTDVPSDSTFYTWIRCLACRGIISGYSDGTFRPGNDITRSQIAKMVSNAAGFNEDPGPQIYEDVDPSHTFYAWINRLSMRGHMGGYPCGTIPEEPCGAENRPYFRPFSNATRGQLAKIVANAAGVGGTPTGLYYTDVPEDNPFYVWIMRLTNLGVMSGYPCGGEGEPCDDANRPYFRPFANVTRGQASKIVANTFYPGCDTPSR